MAIPPEAATPWTILSVKPYSFSPNFLASKSRMPARAVSCCQERSFATTARVRTTRVLVKINIKIAPPDPAQFPLIIFCFLVHLEKLHARKKMHKCREINQTRSTALVCTE